MEFLIELLLEFLLQLFTEVLAELGLHALAEPLRRTPNPLLATLGYAMFGAIAGGLSLLVLPEHLVHAPHLRTVNLLLTPLAVGASMAAIGTWRARHGQSLLRIDRFFHGYVFALAFALVRFHFAA
jgi:hypothetical protein